MRGSELGADSCALSPPPQSRLPVTSIVISTVSVLKSRGDMVGLSEPTVLEFPDLGGVGQSSHA